MNEAFEAGGGDVSQETTAIDPVCGMTVITATVEYRSFDKGKAYYFCSQRCKETFDKEPEKHMKAGHSGHDSH